MSLPVLRHITIDRKQEAVLVPFYRRPGGENNFLDSTDISAKTSETPVTNVNIMGAASMEKENEK